MDYINNEIIKEHKAEKRFTDLNSAMLRCFLVTGRQLEPLPPKPVSSDFYVPSGDHHNGELAFITLSMIGIGAFLWYSDKKIYHIIMSIYIGNDLEDRLKILETESASLKKYNDYHQVVHEIDHMSDLHVDSSFYKQSTKIDNYMKITEWINSLIGQSTVI